MATGDLADQISQCFRTLQGTIRKELNQDPVPEFSTEEIRSTRMWLTSATEAMRASMASFSAGGLQAMDDAALARHAQLARESSMRLGQLHSDGAARFGGQQATGAVVLSKAEQSLEIRGRLEEFSKFLTTFGHAKWLGDLVAPEFQSQKDTAVRLLAALQNPMKLEELSGGGQGQCHRCRRGLVGGGSDLYSSIKASDGTGAGGLDGMADMAELLAAACRRDAEAHRKRMEGLEAKMKELKAFVEVLNDFPGILRRLLLLRVGGIEDHKLLKQWVREDEVVQAIRELEKFRDDAIEERAFRRLAASTGAKSPSISSAWD